MRAVVIEDGDGGTVFTPREGSPTSMTLDDSNARSFDVSPEIFSIIFQVTKEFPNLPEQRLESTGCSPMDAARLLRIARSIRDAGGDAGAVEFRSGASGQIYVSLRLGGAGVVQTVNRSEIREWVALMREVVDWLRPYELYLRTGFGERAVGQAIDVFEKIC